MKRVYVLVSVGALRVVVLFAALGSGCGAAAAPVVAPTASDTGMVRIPGGTFLMGSPSGVGEAGEHPQTQVTLPAFELDRTEVTVAAYGACIASGTCAPLAPGTAEDWCNWGVGGREHHPINCVDWTDADTYCRSVGKRLPTEAEWEYAARGTDGRTYPWGNEEPSDARLAWSGTTARTSTAAVGSYPAGASPFGALDMAGNVWEWTADWHGPYPGGAVTSPHPLGATGDEAGRRVFRGGSWSRDGAFNMRVARQNWGVPTLRDMALGLRCARGGS